MKTILIVDDEKRIRSLYGKMLGRQGYNILKAATLEKAHEIMLSASVDLVVLDMDMGTEEGCRFSQLIGSFFPDICVIVAGSHPVGDLHDLAPNAAGYYDKSECISILTEKVFDSLYPGHLKSGQRNKQKNVF